MAEHSVNNIIFANIAEAEQLTHPRFLDKTNALEDARASDIRRIDARLESMADAVLKTIRLELDDGKYVAYVGDEPDKGTYTLDTASKPKGMTITGTEGPNHGKTFPAIYELGKDETGDTLRICYDLSGTKRPSESRAPRGRRCTW